MSAQAEVQPENQTFVRFTLNQRIEHIVLVVTFTMLAFTGLIQKYFQAPVASDLVLLLGGINTTRLIHRSFAILLTVESVYHVVTVVYGFTGKRRSRPTMLPLPKDVIDFWQMFMFFLGRRKERPLFDRYDFRQKFEYWALVWGTAIMALTGYTMWFSVQVTNFLPGQVIPAALAAHGWEAVLAVLAILIWHMYSAHLNAQVFPLDKTIFTGAISRERLLEEHPLEYARMAEEAARAQAEKDHPLIPPDVEPK